MSDRPKIPARKTMYKGIEMRSRLEARFAGILDGFGVPWRYEGAAFASGTTQYLPDFVVDDSWFIEVKPYLEYESAAHDASLILDQMEVIYESVGAHATLAIASPALGDFMYCDHRVFGHAPGERGIAAWFRCGEISGMVLPAPLFGESAGEVPYWFADGDGPVHVDWGR